MAVQITIETITPQIALKMLEGNTNNRPASRSKIETFARDMRAKKWWLTGDPIKFDGKGKLQDGQKRLLACVLADTPFTTAVARGVTDAAHAAIDIGQTRTFGHQLAWQHEKEYAALATTATMLWSYDNGSVGQKVPSRNEALQTLHDAPELRNSLEVTKSTLRKAPGLHRTSLAVVHYLIGREHELALSDSYVSEVLNGTGYEDGDPCLALRNYAANVRAKRMMRPGQMEWLAIQIKAANYWLLGRPVTMLRWRRVGAQKEPFPQIVSMEEAGA